VPDLNYSPCSKAFFWSQSDIPNILASSRNTSGKINLNSISYMLRPERYEEEIAQSGAGQRIVLPYTGHPSCSMTFRNSATHSREKMFCQKGLKLVSNFSLNKLR
jgi:hypothetical protein